MCPRHQLYGPPRRDDGDHRQHRLREIHSHQPDPPPIRRHTGQGVHQRDRRQGFFQHDLHDLISFVPQKGTLFSGTIASNIRYGNQEATDEQVRQFAQTAQATEFIEEKPEGYDSPVSQGGGNVSGGQKQRLSIARALAKQAPILIFDDSFSALDFKTNAALRRALNTTYQDRTMLIVAQRVSTIMNAQQIIVLDDGEIVGCGTHRELLKNCQVYLEIARSQLSEEEIEHEQ